MQHAIINKSKRLPDDVLAFAAKACDAQVIECAEAWGVAPTPVTFYADESGLPARDVRIMAVVDDLDFPGALGYHDFSLGVVYGRVLAQSVTDTGVTLSHEFLETLVDPYCNAWRAMGGGRSVALEVCDPVQGDTYPVPVTILGERRQVLVSNYVLPRWFDTAARGGFDRMGRLSLPFSMTDGGYLIVRDEHGNQDNVFARARLRYHGMTARLSVAGKLGNGDTRIARRLA